MKVHAFKTTGKRLRAGQSPLAVLFLCALTASSEVITLKNGTTVSGTVVKMDSEEIRIQRCGGVESYPRSEVKSVSMEAAADAGPCAAAPSRLEIPAGTNVVIKLTGFVNSAREPAGQIFPGEIDRSVVVNSQVLLRRGARVVLKLIPAPQLPRQALDVIGIQLPERWASVEPASGKPTALMTVISVEDVRKKPLPEGSDVIQTEGEQVLVPGNTKLTFAAKQLLWLKPSK